MGFNLTNELIDQTFPQLVQISGSVLLNGTGSVITDLDFTGSHVESASHAEFADQAFSASNATNALNANSASFVAGANVIGTVTSASYAATASFVTETVASASFANSASQAEFANSSSFALNFNPAATASYADYATSASYAISTSYADTAVTSSYALNADSASYATFAQNADEANDLVITVKNVSGGTLAVGTAVHAVGVTGENIEVVTASADQAGNMPAVAVLSQEISNNANGTAIINGRLTGINTANLVAGSPVYVNNGGLLTATKPTGSSLIQNIGTAAKIDASDGEIILQGSGRSNDVPNISTGYLWVGNNDHVATPTLSSSIVVDNANTASYVAGANVDGTVASATSASHAVQADNSITATSATTSTSASHAVRADISDNVDSSARLNVTDITASNATFTSASIGNLTTITGSATIIGDQYIILNSDAPTARFAGLKVYDSGSGLTGSFEWDSVDDNWIQVETGGESAGMLTGPSGSKGSETYPTLNTLIKGTGNHTVVDTNITDDGSLVKVNSNTQITGSFNITGSARNASEIQGNFKQNLLSPGLNNQYDLINVPSTTINGQSYTNVNNFFADYSSFGSRYKDYFAIEYYDSFGYNYGSEFSVNGLSTNIATTAENSQFSQFKTEKKAPATIAAGRGTVSGSQAIVQAGGTGSQAMVYGYNGASVALQAIGSQGGSPAYITIDSDSDITIDANNNLYLSGSVSSQDGITAPSFTGSLSSTQLTGSLNITGSSRNASKMIGNLFQSFPSPGNNNTVSLMELSGTNTIGGKNYTNKNFFVADFNSFGNQFQDYFSIEYYDGFGYNYGSEMNVNGIVSRISTVASGSGTLASRTSIVETRDVEDGTGALRLFAGDNTIMKFQANNQGIQVSGSVKSNITALSIASNTASLDCQDGDMFTLSLVSGSDTHLDASNIQAGQTINLKVLQPSTATDSYGTMTFAPEFKFTGGTAPAITAASGSTDILTFQSYDASSLFGTAIQNLS